MNYFTHSTIVLILAIIILLVLLIYTNYLDKSKKIKKQVVLKLDRDEPTQDPSTTVSNNTNHWSNNQLYLHSFSEPLSNADKTKLHEHPDDYYNEHNHISESKNIPISKTVAWAKTNKQANKYDIAVITKSMQPNIKHHLKKYGQHTHYEHPSAKSDAITPDEYKSFHSGTKPIISAKKCGGLESSSNGLKSSSNGSESSSNKKPSKSPLIIGSNRLKHFKKAYCKKSKCVSQEDKLLTIIDHLVRETLNSNTFKTKVSKTIINNAKQLLNNQSSPGLIDLENNIHNVFYSREIRLNLPEYGSSVTMYGVNREVMCSDLVQQYLIESAINDQPDDGYITTQNIQTYVRRKVLISEYIDMTHKFCVNKILQLVNLVHLLTGYFADKDRRNDIVNTLKITLAYIQWVDAYIGIFETNNYWSDANPIFQYNFNKIISTINSTQFICDMEDLHKFTTFSGISKTNPFNITGFISTMQKHIQKINSYGLATLLENCSQPYFKRFITFSIFNPNYTKSTLEPDPKLLQLFQQNENELKKIKTSKNLNNIQVKMIAEGLMLETIDYLIQSKNFENGKIIATSTYIHTNDDSDLDKTVNLTLHGNELIYVSIVDIPKFSEQYIYLKFFK